VRNRSQTIGQLGRAPARQSRSPITPLPAPLPPTRRLPPEEPRPQPGTLRRWLHGAFFDNPGLKFVSIVLAVTVFLLVNDDKDREITVRLGVAYVLPDDRVLVSERVDEVRVTIRGTSRRMRTFDERELPRINVDLRNVTMGEIAFTPEMVQVPAGLTVAGISPRSMRVAFDTLTEKFVEVAPGVAGRPQHGYIVVDVKAAPVTVKVRGGERLLAALSSVRTREVSLEGRTESFNALAALVPPDGIELVGAEQAQVQVHIDEELVTRKMPGLAVSVHGDGIDPARWKVTPSHVEVTLTGALLAVEKSRDLLSPVVRLATSDRGAREAMVTLDGLPPGVGVRISPERVRITPATAAAPRPTQPGPQP
jgi:YbbR domain-containing protein